MPKMEAFISGAWRAPARGEVLIGGAWRRVTRAESYRSDAWVTIASFIPPLSLSISPTSVAGIASTPKPSRRTVYTDYATAIPAGGRSPYSYVWTVADASAESPTTASTRIFASLGPNQVISGTAAVTCTDSAGTVASAQIEYYLSNESSQ